MVTLGEVFRRYGPAYLEQYGQSMPGTHRQALALLQRCRTGELGYSLYRCPECGSCCRVARSCGSRHCPTCQGHKMEQWLDRQMRRLLPCPYFLVTFTVPQELRSLIRSNQKLAYEALFQSSVGALRKLMADPEVLGVSQLGLLAVLHSWGRALEYHPHIHMLVPAGGLAWERVASEDGDSCCEEAVAADRAEPCQREDVPPTAKAVRPRKLRRWRATPAHFLVPVRALSVIFRAKMRDALQETARAEQVPESVWTADWVVHSQAVGNGQNCLRYLARYVFRVAISNRRIVSCDDGQVVFLYRRKGSGRWRRMTLDAMEFIRRFLQHVVPSGFLRVRHYGFLRSNATPSADEMGRLIEQHYDGLVERLPLPETPSWQPPVVPCPECGHPMELVRPKLALPVPACDTG